MKVKKFKLGCEVKMCLIEWKNVLDLDLKIYILIGKCMVLFGVLVNKDEKDESIVKYLIDINFNDIFKEKLNLIDELNIGVIIVNSKIWWGKEVKYEIVKEVMYGLLIK